MPRSRDEPGRALASALDDAEAIAAARELTGQAQPGQVEVERPLGEPAGQVGRQGGVPGRLDVQDGPAARLS